MLSYIKIGENHNQYVVTLYNRTMKKTINKALQHWSARSFFFINLILETSL